MTADGDRLEYIIVWKDPKDPLRLGTFKDEHGRAVSVFLNYEYVKPGAVLRSLEAFTSWLSSSRHDSAFVEVGIAHDWLGWDIAAAEDESDK